MNQSPAGTAASRRRLPDRPSLEQQKKQARELLRALKADDPAAKERLLGAHPNATDLANRPARLADAQVVMAREYGFSSWPILREHVLEIRRMANEIDQEAPAPDRDFGTVHLRCGSDIREGLIHAGFGGEFLEFADPLCRGPVQDLSLEDYLTLRAEFIASAWGMDAVTTRDRFVSEYDGLAQAAEAERLVMWFEHDPYDQLILARVLSLLAERGDMQADQERPKLDRIELILLEDYPGVGRFIGLGQLPPEALRSLWEKRTPVTAPMVSLGKVVWSGLTAPDPTRLARIARDGTPAIPAMAAALTRHLQELPAAGNGLAFLERLTLEALQGGPLTGGQLFRRVIQDDPLPFIGDSMLMGTLDALRAGHQGAIEAETSKEPWPRWTFKLSDFGRDLLAGSADWLANGAPPRWVGGVRIDPNSASVWRWDEASRQVIQD